METPLVSLIIPAYNVRKLIEPCLNSVFGQKIPSPGTMEIIVVDDGSTDGTREWLGQAAAAHPELKVVLHQHQGVAAARNAGLEAARGEYIRFLDGDDLLTADSMGLLLTPALNEQCDFVVGAFYRRVGERQTIRNVGGETRICTPEEYLDFFAKHVTTFFVGVIWNKLFRRDILMAHGIRFQGGTLYGEDFLFVADYLAYCRKVCIVGSPVYVYYLNPKGLTVRQVKSVVTHPILNIRNKARLYRGYKELFQKRQLYGKYRLRIHLYPILVNLSD